MNSSMKMTDTSGLLPFPSLKDIAAKGGGFMESNTSMCSETSEAGREEFSMSFLGFGNASRQATLSTLSNTSVSSSVSPALSASKKKKKKAAMWMEKYETTAVVVGPLDDHDSFRELVNIVKDRVGDIKSHYFRDEQMCGFVYFHNEKAADKCKEEMDGLNYEGVRLKATSPSKYFSSHEEACPDTCNSTMPVRPKLPRQAFSTLSVPTNSLLGAGASTPGGSSSEPTATLVIKNLCFGLKQYQLLDFMAAQKFPPESVSYHYDNAGVFRGVAFAKYHSPEQAAESLKTLNGAEVDGRKLRVEFKRRGATGPAGSPIRQRSFDVSSLSAAGLDIPRRVSAPDTARPSPLMKLAQVNARFNSSMPDKIHHPPTDKLSAPPVAEAAESSGNDSSDHDGNSDTASSGGEKDTHTPPDLPHAVTTSSTAPLPRRTDIRPSTAPSTPVAGINAGINNNPGTPGGNGGVSLLGTPPASVRNRGSLLLTPERIRNIASPGGTPLPIATPPQLTLTPHSPVVIRSGLEFDVSPTPNMIPQTVANTPPPVTSLRCAPGMAMPVLRDNFEFV